MTKRKQPCCTTWVLADGFLPLPIANVKTDDSNRAAMRSRSVLWTDFYSKPHHRSMLSPRVLDSSDHHMLQPYQRALSDCQTSCSIATLDHAKISTRDPCFCSYLGMARVSVVGESKSLFGVRWCSVDATRASKTLRTSRSLPRPHSPELTIFATSSSPSTTSSPPKGLKVYTMSTSPTMFTIAATAYLGRNDGQTCRFAAHGR